MLGHGYSATRGQTQSFVGMVLYQNRAPCVLEDTLQPEWESFFFFLFSNSPGGESTRGIFQRQYIMSEKQQLPGCQFHVCISLTVHQPYGGDVPVVLKGVSPGLSGSLQSQTNFLHSAQTLSGHDERQKPFFTMWRALLRKTLMPLSS